MGGGGGGGATVGREEKQCGHTCVTWVSVCVLKKGVDCKR